MGDINLLIFFTAIFGLCVGSFINVIVFRIPKRISIIFPRSFCFKCKTSIPFYRNIPILTYCLQSGKCHKCKQSISIIYPLVELFTCLIYVLFFMHGFNNFELIESIFSFFIITLLIPMCLIDMKYLYFPQGMLFFSIFIGILYAFSTYWFDNNFEAFFGIFYGIAFLIIIYYVTKFILIKRKNKSPMGFGDILLIIPLGAWLGPINIILCLFLASFVALLSWVTLWIIFNFGLDRRMPFGPYLFFAAIILKITNLQQVLFVLVSQIKS